MNIQEVSYGVLGEANQIEIRIHPFAIGEIPMVSVDIKNDEKTFETRTLEMPQNIYENWGTDDSVVVEWVAEAISVTLI